MSQEQNMTEEHLRIHQITESAVNDLRAAVRGIRGAAYAVDQLSDESLKQFEHETSFLDDEISLLWKVYATHRKSRIKEGDNRVPPEVLQFLRVIGIPLNPPQGKPPQEEWPGTLPEK